MDYLGEVVALGIDTIIFGICLKQYYHCKNAISSIKNAEFHEVGPDLKNILKSGETGKCDYVAIRGAVKSIGEPIQSVNNENVKGVVQRLCVKEHVIARCTSGFWTDQERILNESHHTVPFVLKNGLHQVEISDALAAEILDMDIVADNFEPTAPKFWAHLWGFFTGVRQRGLQSTEEMLREGAIITGIGELTTSPDKPDSLVLQPPIDGTPFYLTTMSINSLVRTLDERRKTYRWLCLIFGAIGVVIGGVVVRRYWKSREEQRLANEMRRELAASRKERRQRVRDTDLREDQRCIVCRIHPREIILLPCGHVCLCEDCSEHITNGCPICRKPIAQKQPAYIV